MASCPISALDLDRQQRSWNGTSAPKREGSADASTELQNPQLEPKPRKRTTVLKKLLVRPLKRRIKGFVGEAIASGWGMLALPSSTYTQLSNLTLPTPDGTTQIDLVIVSRFGVFVVEVKNMSGWIFGSEENRQWTQVFRTGEKHRFQNPLRQNYRHVKAVQQTLGARRIPTRTVHSVIAFIGDATLKTQLPENVTEGLGFSRYVKSFRTPVLTDAHVRAACDALTEARLEPTWRTQREHIRNLRTRNDPTAERKCPRCGKQMVLRTSRHGPNAGRRFWGCSGYPACKATMNTTGN